MYICVYIYISRNFLADRIKLHEGRIQPVSRRMGIPKVEYRGLILEDNHVRIGYIPKKKKKTMNFQSNRLKKKGKLELVKFYECA